MLQITETYRTMQSFSKKIKSLVKEGLQPLEEGVLNFHNQVKEVEFTALKRSKICQGCIFFEDDPISFLRVEDKTLPLLSDKMCGECGCTLSYKLRQSKTKCNKWQE